MSVPYVALWQLGLKLFDARFAAHGISEIQFSKCGAALAQVLQPSVTDVRIGQLSLLQLGQLFQVNKSSIANRCVSEYQCLEFAQVRQINADPPGGGIDHRSVFNGQHGAHPLDVGGTSNFICNWRRNRLRSRIVRTKTRNSTSDHCSGTNMQAT